jgi:hypothetical protein
MRVVACRVTVVIQSTTSNSLAVATSAGGAIGKEGADGVRAT